MLPKGFSTGTCYSLQFGVNEFPLKGVVRFGFPQYNGGFKGGRHDASYNANGSYIEPGLILYSVDISEENATFYLGAFGYFARYHHALKLQITDTWGTNTFEYGSETKVSGLMIEIGGLFTFYKRLKGSTSMTMGGVNRPDNPIPQVQNFKNETHFIPGIGHGFDKFLFGLNLGIHYQIF